MRFLTLEQWLNWQARLHPREIELGLERVSAVWRRMHRTPLPMPVITVGGTNGKGSCVALLDSTLRAAGYRTGCYTSPHLVRYNERIRLQGEMLSDQEICEAFDRVDRQRLDTPLTYFEFGTLAAIDSFMRHRPDVVILEVGLGGRLDAVNIIAPDVALVTNVGIDHSEWLGETREQIALEKAGIMRAGAPAVFGAEDAPVSLVAHAERLGARLHLAGQDFGYRRGDGSWSWWSSIERRTALPLPRMRGQHQMTNAAAVLMTLALLRETLPVDQGAVRAGLQQASAAGRFQVVGTQPTVILDVAHNPQAADALAGNLQEMPCSGQTHALFGMLADKDVVGVVRALASRIDHWHPVSLQGERGLTAGELATMIQRAGVGSERITRHQDLRQAFLAVKQASGVTDRVLVFGSFYLVGPVLEWEGGDTGGGL